MHPCGFLRANISATALEETQPPPRHDTAILCTGFRANLTSTGPDDDSDMAFENEAEHFTHFSTILVAPKGLNLILHIQA